MDNNNIIVSEGRRPLWQVCIAALAYTVTLILLILAGFSLYGGFDMSAFKGSFNTLTLAVSVFAVGLRFSVIQNIYFDLKERRYKKEYAVGPIKVGKWMGLPNVEYISVFRQGWSRDSDGDGDIDAAGHTYDVNVWHDTSRHFTIYSHPEFDPAFEMGKYIALKLKVDLLDATVPNDFKWVEIDSQQQTP